MKVKVLPKKVMTVTQLGNTSLPKKGTTIDNYTKDTITIDSKCSQSADKPPTVNTILDIFYTINPMIKYGHPSYRKAVERLFKQYGPDKVIRVATFACQIRGTPYAPNISNPTQLLDKWSNLEAYAMAKKAEIQKNAITII